jgi:hypothetical protein
LAAGFGVKVTICPAG